MDPAILDVLARHGVHATFFVTGAHAAQHPGLVREILARGHEIGEHTATHVDLRSAGSLRTWLELRSTDLVVAYASGRNTALLRPPYSAGPDSLDDPAWAAAKRVGDRETRFPLRLLSKCEESAGRKEEGPDGYNALSLVVRLRRDVMEPRYDGDLLVGPDGSSWREVAEWLEPDEVVSLVDHGALLAVDDCDGWSWDRVLGDEVMRNVVTAEESHKRSRGKYSGEVIMRASLWDEEGGSRRLVVLSEEVAKKRSVLKDFIRLADAEAKPRFRIHKGHG